MTTAHQIGVRPGHRRRAVRPSSGPSGATRPVRVAVNVIGAVSAAWFVRASLRTYLSTHRLIGAGFVLQQTLVMVAYLARRPARAVSRRAGDWLLAFGGTFGAVLLRPDGAHPSWGVRLGLGLQAIGIVLCVASLVVLGRSFGFAAADRGLVHRGPYALVRHPMYGSYLVLQLGYLVQSISFWNGLVIVFVTACNAGRALVEDRVLASSAHHAAYRQHVRWRMIPGVW